MEDPKVINPQKVYNVEEAAKVLDIGKETLLDYVRSGKITARKIGEWKIIGQSLLNFLTPDRTYKIITHQGISGILDAKNESDLKRKLATGHYKVFPVRGNNMIVLSPETIKEIIDITDETK